ncbi:MAG TPA: hypothetical protein VJN62_13305 [Gemmatimonadales bacterium]|nr:hypothetical protein [Gemmatimonadales bacterium]
MSNPMPPRPSVNRSSFAFAMKDYTFIRPGIAVTISAVTLLVAFLFGIDLIHSLQRASATVAQGARVSQTLHSYSAAYEVWHQMATSTDAAYKRPEAVTQRDQLRDHLRTNLSDLSKTLSDTADQAQVRTILEGLATTEPAATTNARQAMTVLLGRQDAALFDAAETSQQGVLLAAVLLGLTVIAAATLVVPMAWLYVRYKRGATIEVKV